MGFMNVQWAYSVTHGYCRERCNTCCQKYRKVLRKEWIVWRKQLHRLTFLCTLLVVTGCATSQNELEEPAGVQETAQQDPEQAAEAPDVAEVEETAEKARPEPKDYPVAPFEDDTLYELLVAEIAGYRSHYDIALEKYVKAAEETRDPGVANRAAMLALYLKNDDAALRVVKIWAEEEPENVNAHRHAVDLLVRAGRHDEAIHHMEAVKKLGGQTRFEVFAYQAASLPSDRRQALIEAISEMVARHPDDDKLKFSMAILFQQQGRHEEALQIAEDILGAGGQDTNIIILKMTSLNALDRHDEARAFTEEKVGLMPDNRRLRLILARMLFEREDLVAAREQYLQVLETTPNDGDVLFALALIALQNEDDIEAKRYFERMVRWNRRAGEAHYYLGSIADRAMDAETAIEHYRQVGTGYEFVPAHARISALLVEDGRWDDAREHLKRARQKVPEKANQLLLVEGQLLAERGLERDVFVFLDGVLEEDPDNIDLRYFRAMTGERFGYLDILESDLRYIIEIDPENADAMNALGYTLTDQTDRHEEALVLIEKALARKPDEAAFIDSMGWVQYRLNNYDEAIRHLRRALELFQNDEVAAHLGEVLWVVGEKIEALDVWNKALELVPDSEILKETMQRLQGS